MHEISNSINSPQPETPISSPAELRRQHMTMIGVIIGVVILLVVLITCIVLLLLPSTDSSTVTRIRDVFIIFMALESLLIGLVLVVLIVQLARLTNLLQHEIKPILDSTNETVSNLRGTTAFLSANLVEPVMKINEYVAALQRLTEIFGIGRKRS